MWMFTKNLTLWAMLHGKCCGQCLEFTLRLTGLHMCGFRQPAPPISTNAALPRGLKHFGDMTVATHQHVPCSAQTHAHQLPWATAHNSFEVLVDNRATHWSIDLAQPTCTEKAPLQL